MSSTPQHREMKVASRRPLTPEIEEFTLVPAAGDSALPAFTPGAHISVATPSGANRRYSLVNDGSAPDRYVIAVKHEPQSRGGSSSMHDQATVGRRLWVSDPENTFELVPAARYLLIAGGIGITPIQAMARELVRQGSRFDLVYCTREPAETAYREELDGLAIPTLTVHHDRGDPERFFDFWDLFEEPRDVHVYCCGPHALMEEIKAISGHWPEGRIHFEDFKPVEAVRPDDRAFTVTLAGSGRRIEVPADRSILEALRAAGEATVSSCESGTCGTCKCRLIEGRADHRDMVLREDERDRFIMICVSRAAEGDLTIDP
ncbi:MAG: PDR/VanB family oxidoreductase [Azospirillaceae bacterium]